MFSHLDDSAIQSKNNGARCGFGWSSPFCSWLLLCFWIETDYILSGNQTWQWNISMNGGLIEKSLINGPFFIAMFDYRRIHGSNEVKLAMFDILRFFMVCCLMMFSLVSNGSDWQMEPYRTSKSEHMTWSYETAWWFGTFCIFHILGIIIKID